MSDAVSLSRQERQDSPCACGHPTSSHPWNGRGPVHPCAVAGCGCEHFIELCGCARFCGDDGDIDGPGTCKGLPAPKQPLVEIVLVDRRTRTPNPHADLAPSASPLPSSVVPVEAGTGTDSDE